MGGKGKDGPELAPLTAPLRMGTAAWMGGRVTSSMFPIAPIRALGARWGDE